MFDVDEKIKEYGYINFKMLGEERWSIYLLEDGTIMKIKTIPLKFLKRDDNPLINSTIAMTVFAPPNLQEAPTMTITPTTKSDIEKALDKIDMKFETLDEPWNEYELVDGIKFSLRTVVTLVSSTTLHDDKGEPVYWVNHQVLTKKYPPV